MYKRYIFIGLIILIALIGFIKKDFIINELPSLILGSQNFNEKPIKIVLKNPATNLSPYNIEHDNLIRTSNVYEGLVAFDGGQKIIPSLAYSWKNTDKLTWEFKLRREVVFHDNHKFDASSVKKSFENAQKQGNSKIKNLLSTIKEIKVKNPSLIQITTKKIDPILPKKLTQFYIGRSGNIGTGPYKIQKWEKDKKLSLVAFKNYWSKLPKYKNVDFIVIKDQKKQKIDFDKGLIDIIAKINLQMIDRLKQNQSSMRPGFEVGFLMFNVSDPIFSKKSIREFIFNNLRPIPMEDAIDDLAPHASQFAAPDVDGFSHDIPMPNFERIPEINNILRVGTKKITLNYSPNIKKIIPLIKNQLINFGFNIKKNPLDSNK